MNPPHCHEVTLLRRQLDAAERELAHRANAAAVAADRYTRMRAIAIPCNPRSTCFPAAPPAVLPNHPGPC